jgi:glucosamine--fructose-6-phosphate aminotransferase (isomerizing)
VTTRMRLEIAETTQVVARLLDAVPSETRPVAEAIREARPRFAAIVARGTSDHAGTYARYLIETQLGMVAGLVAPSVTTVYGARLCWQDTLLLSFSQSGQSPDICAVTEAARSRGALTLAITNDPASPLASTAEHVLPCHAGEERAVAATKTYVAELAAVAALVAELAPDSDLARATARLPEAIAAAIREGEAWLDRQPALPAELSVADRALVVSRGFNYATALEVALKLKETSRIFADGYSTADLLHGPVTLAGPRVPLLVFRPDGPMGHALDRDLARAVAHGARPWYVGGPELAFGAVPGLEPRDEVGAQEPLILDNLPEPLTPLSYVIPGQLLAGAVARRRGLDPDAPEGLSKVTLTR